MSEQQQTMMQVLRSTPANALPDIPAVVQRFTDLVMKVQQQPKGVAEAIFHSEKFHYLKQINDNKALKDCDQLSLYGCFLDMAVNGLSFDPTKKLCYIIPENVNVGTKDNPRWEKRARLEVSPYGELAIRQRAGQIKYADDPIIVYEGDHFAPMVKEGKKYVDYALNLNHSNVIIGSFIHIVRLDGSDDYYWLLREDIARLKAYSEKKNKGYANALYSSVNGQIDSGFLAAKTIKHAFKSYPKVNLRGDFAKLEPEVEEVDDIYGIDMTTGEVQEIANVEIPAGTIQPDTKVEIQAEAKQTDFSVKANTQEAETISFEDKDETF